MSLYFEVLSLAPTRAEIRLAVDRILGANADEYIGFPYTKRIVVDIALHIFVPKGTHLENSRRSTWLCPLVGNDDAALRFGDNYKKISLRRYSFLVNKNCEDYQFSCKKMTLYFSRRNFRGQKLLRMRKSAKIRKIYIVRAH